MAIYCAKCGTKVGVIGACRGCKKNRAVPADAPAPAKTPGQIAYEEDYRRCPRHDDGSARPTWEGLSTVYVETTAQAIRGTWERNPTPRQWKTNNENHRGPAHRDYTGPDGLFPALT